MSIMMISMDANWMEIKINFMQVKISKTTAGDWVKVCIAHCICVVRASHHQLNIFYLILEITYTSKFLWLYQRKSSITQKPTAD